VRLKISPCPGPARTGRTSREHPFSLEIKRLIGAYAWCLAHTSAYAGCLAHTGRRNQRCFKGKHRCRVPPQPAVRRRMTNLVPFERDKALRTVTVKPVLKAALALAFARRLRRKQHACKCATPAPSYRMSQEGVSRARYVPLTCVTSQAGEPRAQTSPRRRVSAGSTCTEPRAYRNRPLVVRSTGAGTDWLVSLESDTRPCAPQTSRARRTAHRRQMLLTNHLAT
jgi:hypothetical protein